MTREAIDLWIWMQAGVLPHSGGLYDQPELLIRMMEAVERARPRRKG